jgi:lipoprotein-anchoring transpeptidase ErfK/SrfK
MQFKALLAAGAFTALNSAPVTAQTVDQNAAILNKIRGEQTIENTITKPLDPKIKKTTVEAESQPALKKAILKKPETITSTNVKIKKIRKELVDTIKPNQVPTEIKPKTVKERKDSNIECKKPGRYADVNLTEQMLRVCNEGNLVYVGKISSGKESTPTPEGTYEVQGIQLNTRLKGGSGSDTWDVPVKYFIHFNGNIGFHPGVNPGYPASHGCVRTAEGAETGLMYLREGDKVSIYRAVRSIEVKNGKIKKTTTLPESVRQRLQLPSR